MSLGQCVQPCSGEGDLPVPWGQAHLLGDLESVTKLTSILICSTSKPSEEKPYKIFLNCILFVAQDPGSWGELNTRTQLQDEAALEVTVNLGCVGVRRHRGPSAQFQS